jgi:hypothetical protein
MKLKNLGNFEIKTSKKIRANMMNRSENRSKKY